MTDELKAFVEKNDANIERAFSHAVEAVEKVRGIMNSPVVVSAVPRILLCFTSGRGPFAWAIRRLTGSKVNHAFVAWHSTDLDGWVTIPQADERGCVAVAAESVTYRTIECYEAPGYDLARGLPEMRHILGLGYDWLGIVGFLARLIVWRLARRRIRNPWQCDDRFFCSEACTTFLAASGVRWAHYGRDVYAASTSPGDLLGMVRGDNHFRRVEAPWKGREA